jgi:1-acyl-sn-glycerol-3-phosphate acyltransferase
MRFWITEFWKVHIHYPRIKPNGPAVYVCNHLSNIDFMFLVFIRPFTGRNWVVVCNSFVGSVPFFGSYLKRNGAIFIDRSVPESTKQCSEKMKDALDRGVDVYMFPEGKRNANPSELAPFFKGAFRMPPQYLIYPVVWLHLERIAPLGCIPGNTTEYPIHMDILNPIVKHTEDVDEMCEYTWKIMNVFYVQNRNSTRNQKQRQWDDKIMWTHIWFVLPILYSIWKGMWKDACEGIFAVFVSSMYHRSFERKWRIFDNLTSKLLFIKWICQIYNRPDPLLWFCLSMTIRRFIQAFSNYCEYHSEFHMWASLFVWRKQVLIANC